MSTPPFRRYTRRDRTSASDQNALRQRVEDAARSRPADGGGLHALSRAGAQILVSDVAEPVWLRIDGAPAGTDRYESWTEVIDDGSGNFGPVGDDGLAGSPDLPAWLVAGAAPAVGDVVLAWWSGGGESLLFEGPPGTGTGGTLTVEGSTGSPLYSGVNTLVADQSNGFLSLSQPAAGQAELTVNPGAAGAAVELARAVASFTRPILPPPEDEAGALIRQRVFNHLPPPFSSVTVAGSFGTPVLNGVIRLEVNQTGTAGGLTLSLTQPASGTARISAGLALADVGTTGTVSGANQNFSGAKVFTEAMAVGPTVATVYFLSGGTSIISNVIAKITAGGGGLTLTPNVGFTFEAAGHAEPTVSVGNGSGFDAGGTSDGTTTGGLTFRAGWFTGGTFTAGGVVIGSTGVTGGTGGNLLYQDGGGHVGSLSPQDAGLTIAGQVFAPRR